MLINDKVDAVFIPDSPSRIKATDYNQIKNEIQECIKEAGLTPTKDVIQLPQALKILTAQSGAEEVAKIEAAGQEQLNAINTAGAQAVQDAQDAADTATSKATEAASSASAAASSASEASGSASTATTQATNASASAELAQKWATQTTAEVVSGQGYGAKYYADQAADSAASIVQDAEAAAASATAAAGSASAAAQSAQEAADSAQSINPDNLANKGLENTDRLTNCITKIPQDIKFELSSEGTLTLKAGSKVWYPNGKDEAGKNVFASLTLAEDMSFGYGSILDNLFLMLSVDGSANWITPDDTNNNITSGGTGPSQSTARRFWYDTANNKIYCYAPNSDTPLQGTFPLAILKCTAKNVFEIKQVFNGFGYIGQVLFALPGVEGLSPGGRNADGSLCNYTMTVSNVLTRSFTWSCDDGQAVFVGQYNTATATEATRIISSGELHNYFQQSEPPSTIYANSIWHKLDENKVYKTDNDTTWDPVSLFVVGRLFNTGAGTNVSSLTIGNPVAAVDMSNTSYIAKMAMPSNRYVDLTLGATGATYTAPANGYFYINAAGNGNNNWIEMTNNSAAGFARGVYGTTAWSFKNALEAKGGDSVTIRYNNINTPTVFRFIYAEGEK